MNGAAAAGALLGLATWFGWLWLHPPRPPLAAALVQLANPRPRRPPRHDTPTFDARVGATLRRVGIVERILTRFAPELRLLDRDPNEVAASVVAGPAVGLLAGPVFVVLAAVAADVHLPPVAAGWLALAGAAAGLAVPLQLLRRDVTEARRAFAHALGAFCDVAAMAMAAGRETEESLTLASRAGDGRAFRELRGALEGGQAARIPAWEALRRLGEELHLPDLVELAGSMRLAGAEGAAVRQSVRQRARSIRHRLTSDTERRASAVTQRMVIPGVIVLVGFLVLLAYPPLTEILTTGI